MLKNLERLVRLSLGVAAGSAALLALASCGGRGNKAPQDGVSHETTAEDAETDRLSGAWEIVYRSRCASGAEADCPGNYGFTLFPDGRFRIGPGPEGQSVMGSVSSAEFSEVERRIHSALLQDSTVGEICTPGTGQEHTDSVKYIGHGEEIEVTRAASSEICYRVPSERDALDLHLAVRNLVLTHYPKTFPGPCFDAIAELDKLHSRYQRCETDSDCIYITDEYSPAGSGDGVTSDDCTFIRPMVVGNGFETVANQLKLLTAADLARELCGEQAKRAGCETEVVMNFSGRGTPLCRQGMCALN